MKITLEIFSYFMGTKLQALLERIKETSFGFLRELDKRRYEEWERRASRGYSVQDFLSALSSPSGQ